MEAVVTVPVTRREDKLAALIAKLDVLDPFLGSGTTAQVALALGRSCVGIELNPEYAALARRRVNAWGPKRARMAQTSMDVSP